MGSMGFQSESRVGPKRLSTSLMSLRSSYPRVNRKWLRGAKAQLKRKALTLLVVALLVSGLAWATSPASSAQPADFGSTSAAIASAYATLASAAREGGNVTALVSRLNVALGLYSRAEAENQSEPLVASQDLMEATAIAQNVSQSAPGVGQAGSAARQLQEELSVGSAAAILAVAAVLYAYGEKIYHRLWLSLYSGFVVKKVG